MRRTPADVVVAEASYRAALDRALELGMRPLEAHCRRDLGLLFARADRAEQARDRLVQAAKLYRAMTMPFWLPETEFALERLG